MNELYVTISLVTLISNFAILLVSFLLHFPVNQFLVKKPQIIGVLYIYFFYFIFCIILRWLITSCPLTPAEFIMSDKTLSKPLHMQLST